MLALGFYIDSTACADAIYELVRLSAQHFFAVAANDLVGCFVVINNALPLVCALGFNRFLGSCKGSLAPEALTSTEGIGVFLFGARLSITAQATYNSTAIAIRLVTGLPLMLTCSKGCGDNADNHNNNHQQCQNFLFHWFNKPPF